MSFYEPGNTPATSPLRRYLPLIIGGSLIALGLIVALSLFFTRQGVISQANKHEATLTAAYADGANYLSNCVVKTKQAAGVAKANAAAFEDVIQKAVAGSGDASHVDLNTPAGRNAFLPMLVQAYPDLKGQTDLFNRVVIIITGCQDDFRGKQTNVLERVSNFNEWRTGSTKVRWFSNGIPNENLKVLVAGQALTGQDALDKMSVAIVDAATNDAYTSGEQSADDPFAESAPN